jgi:photosystem II stability/assembly factor-like uncharacterized protein
MLKNLPKTLWKVLLVSLLFFGILLQVTQIAAKTDPGSASVLTASPTPTPYIIYLPVLNASPQFTLTSIWTADSLGTPKSTFVPGETIRFYTTGFNNSGDLATAGLSWYQEGPCGSSTISIESVNIGEEGWTRYKTSVVPDCTGIYTFTLNISYGGEISTYTAAYVVNYPSQVIHSTRQAFDRCNIPSTSQMQKWWTSSPYYGVNLYIGGISRGCANTGLNEFYVHMISQQGWELIPTWVGPQAPCSAFKNKMSSNAGTAYLQGRNEASSAAQTAAALGFSKDRVVYYDLEGYASATLACRETVKSFLKGWTERLHELGVLSGVYGAAYSSYMNDWAAVSPPPDYVWIASWYRSYYDPYATVWGVNFLSDSLWSNHQRLRQYAGDHTETWGGISLTIDSNVSDGAVAKIPITLSAQDFGDPLPESSELSAQPEQLREMQQVSFKQGWVIKDHQLLWTEDGGGLWEEITPPIDPPGNLLTAYFQNETKGWLVVQEQATGKVSVFRTDDRGRNWHNASIDLSGAGFDPQINSASVSFVDQQSGWVALKHNSSSNFSLGTLFGTKDGGITWEQLTMPVAGKISFKDGSTGWVAGGASGGELYATFDGGRTWENQGSSLLPEMETGELFFGLPTIVDEQTGYLPLTVADPESLRVEVFASNDGGASWNSMTSIPIDAAAFPGSAIPLESLDHGQLFLASGGPAQIFSIEPGGMETLQLVETSFPGQILAVDSAQPGSGWVMAQSGECTGNKQNLGESVPEGQVQFTCQMESHLYKTLDGGKSWTEISP